MSFDIFVLLRLVVKARNQEDKVLYETSLEIRWIVQGRVCFLKTIGNLGMSGLPRFTMDSRLFESIIGFDSLDASSVRFSLFFNFDLCE